MAGLTAMIAVSFGCRSILGIDDDRRLLGGGGAQGETFATQMASHSTTASDATTASAALSSTSLTAASNVTTSTTSAGASEWANWSLTPDGAPTSNYLLTSETATDKTTGLMWIRSVTPDLMTFEDATGYCDELSRGGYDNWRLPTRIELLTLVTFAFAPLKVNSDVFFGFDEGETVSSLYRWTSSRYRYANAQGERWYVNFQAGSTYHDLESAQLAVICVRRSQ